MTPSTLRWHGRVRLVADMKCGNNDLTTAGANVLDDERHRSWLDEMNVPREKGVQSVGICSGCSAGWSETPREHLMRRSYCTAERYPRHTPSHAPYELDEGTILVASADRMMRRLLHIAFFYRLAASSFQGLRHLSIRIS